MMCQTPEEAFQAGWDAPCEHDIPNPVDCPDCRLTPEELARLAVLHGLYLRPSLTVTQPTAA